MEFVPIVGNTEEDPYEAESFCNFNKLQSYMRPAGVGGFPSICQSLVMFFAPAHSNLFSAISLCIRETPSTNEKCQATKFFMSCYFYSLSSCFFSDPTNIYS